MKKKSPDAPKTKTTTSPDAAVPKRTRAPRQKTAPVIAADEMVEQEATTWSDPTDDEIARRAYEIFESRDELGGDAMADWLQAERELKLQR
ncbi:MAG: DUF2934 domain-containing protein [Acidobacteria bacterium]|nr:DUF2934 domain-containing protein [Acidobacteriota bacterium]